MPLDRTTYWHLPLEDAPHTVKNTVTHPGLANTLPSFAPTMLRSAALTSGGHVTRDADERLSETLEQTLAWMKDCARLLDGQILRESTARTRRAAALFDLSLEHSQSVHVLISAAQLASATALLRPQLEACLRAVWLLHAPDTPALQRVLKGKEELPAIGKVKTFVLSMPESPISLLLQNAVAIIGALHDFTHGGSRQIHLRLAYEHVGRNPDPVRARQILRWSTALSYTAAIGLAEICRDAATLDTVHRTFHAHGFIRQSVHVEGPEDADL